MKYLNKLYITLITYILLIISISLTACSFLDTTSSSPCNNHANISMNLKKYITHQYSKKKFIRLGIFPFSVPANFTSTNINRLDYSISLAQKMQPTLLSLGTFSTAELLNYREWSGKKEEFFSNNLQAIEIGKNIGLDFVVVGYMSPTHFINKMTIYSKIIDVNTGITIFYGETTATNENLKHPIILNSDLTNLSSTYLPNDLKLDELTETTIACHNKLVRQIK